MNDDMFQKNLKIIEIENNSLTNILTPNRMLQYMFIKCCFTQYQMNKKTKEINEKINEKITINLQEKYSNL